MSKLLAQRCNLIQRLGGSNLARLLLCVVLLLLEGSVRRRAASQRRWPKGAASSMRAAVQAMGCRPAHGGGRWALFRVVHASASWLFAISTSVLAAGCTMSSICGEASDLSEAAACAHGNKESIL